MLLSVRTSKEEDGLTRTLIALTSLGAETSHREGDEAKNYMEGQAEGLGSEILASLVSPLRHDLSGLNSHPNNRTSKRMCCPRATHRRL
jgi:hypothetical protein